MNGLSTGLIIGASVIAYFNNKEFKSLVDKGIGKLKELDDKAKTTDNDTKKEEK